MQYGNVHVSIVNIVKGTFEGTYLRQHVDDLPTMLGEGTSSIQFGADVRQQDIAESTEIPMKQAFKGIPGVPDPNTTGSPS